MDALLPAFLAAFLAEFGDRTQLLVLLLAGRFPRHAPVFAGIALAALANSLIAAAGGHLIHAMIPFRALSLMVALALLSAAAGALWRTKPPGVAIYDRLGAFGASFLAFFILEFGDKTQFLTFAFAARADSLLLTACGATGGIVLASMPAILLGPSLATRVPIRPLRIAIAGLFALVGGWVALDALRLI